jgi:hypothetical protein
MWSKIGTVLLVLYGLSTVANIGDRVAKVTEMRTLLSTAKINNKNAKRS